MERTAIRLGGVELDSSVMNASGPHSAEQGEIYELSAQHKGALVFKSCNIAGLQAPENLKNRGVEHFAAIARELAPRRKAIIASVVGNTEDEIVKVAGILDRAGVKIVELNLADDYVMNSVAPFASYEKLEALIGRIRGEIDAALAIKLPLRPGALEAGAIAELLKRAGVAVAVCANDLPKDLEIDIATGRIKGATRPLSQAHAFWRLGDGAYDVVAVGGVNTGRDAYVAHLIGAKAVGVGSALMKEGAGALGRIDRELDGMLEKGGKRSVNEIIGQAHFESLT
jgi:dihydroorotate dehydrogenase (fumarate)